MQWWVEYTLDYKEDLRNTQKAFYAHGSTKLNIKILIVSCATKWLIFQNSVTYKIDMLRQITEDLLLQMYLLFFLALSIVIILILISSITVIMLSWHANLILTL